MRFAGRRRQFVAMGLGVLVLVQLVGCVPEPDPTAGIPPTPGASSTAGPSASASPAAEPTGSPGPSAPSEPTPGVTDADVVIITADLQPGGLEVTGIVTGHVDPAGVCRLTVSLDDGTTRSAEALANPTNGNSFCPLMVIPSSDLSSGAWQVTLDYQASGVVGTSAPVTVEVP